LILNVSFIALSDTIKTLLNNSLLDTTVMLMDYFFVFVLLLRVIAIIYVLNKIKPKQKEDILETNINHLYGMLVLV